MTRCEFALPQVVPFVPPYGSITPEDIVCTRCGESKTGCSICAGHLVEVVKVYRDEKA